MRLNLNIHIKLLISKQDETWENPELHRKFSCKILNFSPMVMLEGKTCKSIVCGCCIPKDRHPVLAYNMYNAKGKGKTISVDKS